MIIGMPVIMERCPQGHRMTRDNVCRLRSGGQACVSCLRWGGLESLGDRRAMEEIGLDYAILGSAAWVPGYQLRLAYERGERVRRLVGVLGRSEDTVRRRIREAGGRTRSRPRPARWTEPSSSDLIGLLLESEPDPPVVVEDPVRLRAQASLRVAERALIDRWEARSAAVRINEEASRLAETLTSDVHWSDHGDWEPRPDLTALHDYRGGPRPARRRRVDGEVAYVMITLTERQHAQLSLLARERSDSKSALIRRLLSEHVAGSSLPIDPRGGHSKRFPLSLNAYEREHLRELARVEKISMSALVRALIARAIEPVLADGLAV